MEISTVSKGGSCFSSYFPRRRGRTISLRNQLAGNVSEIPMTNKQGKRSRRINILASPDAESFLFFRFVFSFFSFFLVFRFSLIRFYFVFSFFFVLFFVKVKVVYIILVWWSYLEYKPSEESDSNRENKLYKKNT